MNREAGFGGDVALVEIENTIDRDKKKFVAKILIHRRMCADYLRGEPERLRERPLGVGLGK